MLDLHAVILEDLEHIVSQPVSWDKLQGKTVLVTGASGMIASYLVFTLLYLNDTRHLNIRVLALVRNGEKAKQQFGNILVRSDITLLIQDVSQVLDYSGPVDYIVHAASQASPRFFTTDPVGTIQANTMGTENMLRTAMERKSEGFSICPPEKYMESLMPIRVPSPKRSTAFWIPQSCGHVIQKASVWRKLYAAHTPTSMVFLSG